MLKVGILGAGYWGPNLIRNFNHLNTVEVKWVCDLDQKKLGKILSLYPNINTTTNCQKVFDDPEIDAVVIATPPQTHTTLTIAALQKGKHCLVEKPLTDNLEEALKIQKIAAEMDRIVMCGHTFLYNSAVRYLKELVQKDNLGKIYYAHSRRLSLGLYQKTIDVVWDLAPHDISIITWLFDNELPESVSATGSYNINPNITDVASITLKYQDGRTVFIQNSWLDPKKVRELILVGQKKMVVYDDIEPLEKIKIYQKSVDGPGEADTFGDWQYTYNYGDIMIPHLKLQEPLAVECQHFIDCIQNKKKPLTDLQSGVDVIRILEATSRSLKENGAPIKLEH